jgi:hypothetical protein
MARRFEIGGACALGLLLGIHAAGAQSLAQVGNESAEGALRELAQRADVIFAGRVVGVHRRAGQGGATGVVEIEFAVDDAVRGAAGGTYTLREWAGLWAADETPFRVGQRYLMLLHRPGGAGLSSPVGGQDGAIPIRGGVAGSEGGVPVPMVDLRWVAARVVRPAVYAPEPVRIAPPVRFPGPAAGRFGGILPQAMQTGAESYLAPGVGLGVELAAPVSQDIAYTAVLAMMHGWERTRHATR